MDRHIMTNILKMLDTGILDTDFFRSYLQGTHQCQGIVIRTVCRSETGHRYTDNTFARKSQLIKCLDADQQSQSGIKPSRNTDHYGLASRMYQTFRQTGHLNGEYFLATFIQ